MNSGNLNTKNIEVLENPFIVKLVKREMGSKGYDHKKLN